MYYICKGWVSCSLEATKLLLQLHQPNQALLRLTPLPTPSTTIGLPLFYYVFQPDSVHTVNGPLSWTYQT